MCSELPARAGHGPHRFAARGHIVNMNVGRMYCRVFCLLVAVCLAPLARAESGVEEAIRSYLEGLDAGASPIIAGRLLENPEALSRLYRDRDHQALWLPGAPLQDDVLAMLVAIDDSVSHGFVAERYHREKIEQLRTGNGVA